jgi:hypothetical protein
VKTIKNQGVRICQTCGKEFTAGPAAKYCPQCRKKKSDASMKGIPVPVKNAEAPPLPIPKGSPSDHKKKQIEESNRLLKLYGTTNPVEIEQIKLQRGEV